MIQLHITTYISVSLHGWWIFQVSQLWEFFHQHQQHSEQYRSLPKLLCEWEHSELFFAPTIDSCVYYDSHSSTVDLCGCCATTALLHCWWGSNVHSSWLDSQHSDHHYCRLPPHQRRLDVDAGHIECGMPWNITHCVCMHRATYTVNLVFLLVAWWGCQVRSQLSERTCLRPFFIPLILLCNALRLLAEAIIVFIFVSPV